MNRKPLISVILPVYNGEQYLRQAVTSILTQDIADFELLVCNDGSTDASLSILKTFSDPRIRILENKTNLGLIPTLNRLIDESKGDFIARMDADDVSLPVRFSSQLQIFKTNKEAGLVCGFMSELVAPKKTIAHKYVASDQLKAALLFTNTIVHPTVMFRSAMIKGRRIYSEEYPHAEDYAAWLQLLDAFEFEIVPRSLILHRAHQNQVSVLHYQTQIQSIKQAQKNLFERLGVSASSEELQIHSALFIEQFVSDSEFIHKAKKWLEKLANSNIPQEFFNKDVLREIIAEWWFRTNQIQTSHGLSNFEIWKSSKLAQLYIPPSLSKLKMQINSAFKKKRND